MNLRTLDLDDDPQPESNLVTTIAWLVLIVLSAAFVALVLL